MSSKFKQGARDCRGVEYGNQEGRNGIWANGPGGECVSKPLSTSLSRPTAGEDPRSARCQSGVVATAVQNGSRSGTWRTLVVALALPLASAADADAGDQANVCAVPPGRLLEKVNRAWDVSWSRFYRPETDLFYDYLSGYETGRELAHLPTADEVSRQYPNPYGYGTGMEDCMISAGVMLSMIIDRHSVTHDDALKSSAKKVFDGIVRCAEVHGVPGFIARGVCPEDRRGIYKTSSRDQYTHCVHGLWQYFHSDLCDPATKPAIARILSAIADRMTRNVTPENDYDFLTADGQRDPRGICRMFNVDAHEAARLPMFYAAAWDVGRKDEWRQLYRKHLPPAVAQSFELKPATPTYALLQMQCSLELLRDMETDADLKRGMEEAMKLVARKAAERSAKAARDAERLDLKMVGPDWRVSGGLKGEYRKVWYCIRESGEAALAQLMAGSDCFGPEQADLLVRAIDSVDNEHVSSGGIFYLQAAYWKARRLGILGQP